MERSKMRGRRGLRPAARGFIRATTSDYSPRNERGEAMRLSVKPSGAALGAEIGYDLSGEMDERQFRAIEAAFHDNIMVLVRGQTMSNARHIVFSRRFGELEIHIVKKYLLPDHPEILRISNIRDENGELIGLADAGFTWHTDSS